MAGRSQQQRLFFSNELPDPDTMEVGQVVLNLADGFQWTKNLEGELVPLKSADVPADVAEVYKVRGVSAGTSGQYYLQPTDNVTMLVFVTAATVVIPDNVIFPDGFRCWLRQARPDPEYVYVQPEPAIILESYKGVNGTEEQYAVVELVKIAGGTWTLIDNGMGEVHADPPANSLPAYVPNPGVTLTSGKAEGLNISTSLSKGTQLSFRGYIRMYTPQGTPDPPDQPPPPDPVVGFHTGQQWLRGGYLVNSPTDAQLESQYGLVKDRTWYGQDVWAQHPDQFGPEWNGKKKPPAGWVDSTYDAYKMPIESNIRSRANSGSEPLVAYDIENGIWLGWYRGSGSTTAQKERMSLDYGQILDWAINENGANKRFGFYRMVPYRFPGYQSSFPGPGDSAYDAWVQGNNDLLIANGMVEKMTASWTGMYFQNADVSTWKLALRANLEEANRILQAAGNTDCTRIVTIWPRVHSTSSWTNPNVPTKYRKLLIGNWWRQMLDEIYTLSQPPYNLCNGFTIWGWENNASWDWNDSNFRNDTDENNWWGATLAFLRETLGRSI